MHAGYRRPSRAFPVFSCSHPGVIWTLPRYHIPQGTEHGGGHRAQRIIARGRRKGYISHVLNRVKDDEKISWGQKDLQRRIAVLPRLQTTMLTIVTVSTNSAMPRNSSALITLLCKQQQFLSIGIAKVMQRCRVRLHLRVGLLA